MKIFIGIPITVVNDATNKLAELCLLNWNEVARSMPDYEFEIVQVPVLADPKFWDPSELDICKVTTLDNPMLPEVLSVWSKNSLSTIMPSVVNGWNQIVDYANRATPNYELNWIIMASMNVFVDAMAVDGLIQMMLDEPSLYINTGYRTLSASEVLPNWRTLSASEVLPNWIYPQAADWKHLDFNCWCMAANDTRWQSIGPFDPKCVHDYWAEQDYLIRLLLGGDYFGVCGSAGYISFDMSPIQMATGYRQVNAGLFNEGRKYIIKKWFYNQDDVPLNAIFGSPDAILYNCSRRAFDTK